MVLQPRAVQWSRGERVTRPRLLYKQGVSTRSAPPVSDLRQIPPFNQILFLFVFLFFVWVGSAAGERLAVGSSLLLLLLLRPVDLVFMASSPPVLPISSHQAGQTAGSGLPTAPTGTPATWIFASRLSESVRRSLANRRSWSELIDRSAFSRPESTSEAISRVRKNLSYFRVNYMAVIAVVLAVSLLTNPVSLVILLGLLAGWCFLYLFRPADTPLVILGRQFSDRETLGGLVCLTVFAVFLTSVVSVIISALLAGAAIVCAHGAFRVPEDLFLDDQEPAGPATGFLSFLGGAAASAAAAAGTPAAARV